MFSLTSLRKPYHMLDQITKNQLDKTMLEHKKINEKFLDERIKPRIIIFMEDGTNMMTKSGQIQPPDTRRGPNNCAINVNKYIAKYDFEIAKKLFADVDTNAGVAKRAAEKAEEELAGVDSTDKKKDKKELEQDEIKR